MKKPRFQKSNERGENNQSRTKAFPRLISKLAKINPDLACRLDVQGFPAFKDEYGKRWFRPVHPSSNTKERQS